MFLDAAPALPFGRTVRPLLATALPDELYGDWYCCCCCCCCSSSARCASCARCLAAASFSAAATLCSSLLRLRLSLDLCLSGSVSESESKFLLALRRSFFTTVGSGGGAGTALACTKALAVLAVEVLEGTLWPGAFPAAAAAPSADLDGFQEGSADAWRVETKPPKNEGRLQSNMVDSHK